MDVNKDDFPDVMVDLETTGTDPSACAIIQISAVRFNLMERTVSPDFFDRCLLIPKNRFWQEGGRAFWLKRQKLLQSIMSRMEEPEVVIRGFLSWLGGQRVLWAKPSHFEFPFLEQYFSRFEIQNPFFYRSVQDMNSFFRGLYFPESVPDFERQLSFEGQMHNGLHDTLHQLRVLFHTVDDALKKRALSSVENLKKTEEIKELFQEHYQENAGVQEKPKTPPWNE